MFNLSLLCRKKRKWDQPAETLVAAGIAVPGVIPLGNAVVPLRGIAFPGISPVACALSTNPLAASCATVPQVLQAPSVQLHTAAAVQKINQVRTNSYNPLILRGKGGE